MTARRWLAALLASIAAVAVGVALTGVGSARSAKPKVVQVCDSYYAPKTCDGSLVGKVSIRKRGKVKWEWTPVFNNHNVTLKSAPQGVRKSRFRSQTTSNPDYHFTKRFRKPGLYRFFCTIHPTQMRMKVVVRRPHRQ
jgi:copper binding plastocyanin/azurin family protein